MNNYYTKPLQGKLFWTLGDIIMGTNGTFPVKECIETSENMRL